MADFQIPKKLMSTADEMNEVERLQSEGGGMGHLAPKVKSVHKAFPVSTLPPPKALVQGMSDEAPAGCYETVDSPEPPTRMGE